jgi:hypothetical protein
MSRFIDESDLYAQQGVQSFEAETMKYIPVSDVDSRKKWMISLLSAFIFFVISSPFLYKLTNSLAKYLKLQLASYDGAPTLLGLVVHAVVFMLIVRALML